MGCCASIDTRKQDQPCHSLVRLPPLPPSRKIHLPKPQPAFPPPLKEEDTVVKQVQSERSSPEVRGAGNTWKFWLKDEVPETKIFFNNLEEAVETVSGYSKRYSTSRDAKAMSSPIWKMRRQQKLNAHSIRSPMKAQRKHPLTSRVRLPHSHPHSPARSAQLVRPEFHGAGERELSGDLRARQCNVGTPGKGASGVSPRPSRSQAPARIDVRGNKPGRMLRIPPVEAKIDGGWEGRQKTAEEDPEDFTNVSEQRNEPPIDNPHVSLECFIFL